MKLHIRVPVTLDSTFCNHKGASEGVISLIDVGQYRQHVLCADCVRLVHTAYPEGVPTLMKPAEALEKVVKEEEKPNKYSILQSDQGRWQILQRAEGAGYWIVTVKDCGSMRMATLLLNAIITGAKPGTREHEILNASSK